jgi:hypothetical protein
MFLTVTEAGDVSEQVELAVKWAIERGLTTWSRLKVDAQQRNRRVYDLVSSALVRRP